MRRLRWLPLLFSLPSLFACTSVVKQDAASGSYALSLPGKDWSLLVDLPGFELERAGVRDDETGAILKAWNEKLQMTVTVFLEKEAAITTTAVCRDQYWWKLSESPMPRSDVQHRTFGSMAVVESTIQDFLGFPMMQKHLHAYLYHDGTCTDMHISKVQYDAQDKLVFDAIVGSVRVSADR